MLAEIDTVDIFTTVSPMYFFCFNKTTANHNLTDARSFSNVDTFLSDITD